MNNPVEPSFLLTREYRRFAEFCDACRRYRYIGLCHGPPGVGKTLSARHYANWDKIELLVPHSPAFEEAMTGILNTNTVFYTPRVVNSPRQVEAEIRRTALPPAKCCLGTTSSQAENTSGICARALQERYRQANHRC